METQKITLSRELMHLSENMINARISNPGLIPDYEMNASLSQLRTLIFKTMETDFSFIIASQTSIQYMQELIEETLCFLKNDMDAGSLFSKEDLDYLEKLVQLQKAFTRT
jgi:hypothetical protein